MDKIRWGIIGCGNVTEIKSGPAFRLVPNSSLVAVMRRDAAKASDYAQRHGVPRWYSNAGELINDPEVDAVYIATPPLQHEGYALDTISAGKPVYLEKPMATDSAAAGRIARAAQSSGIKLSVAHYRRKQPLFLKIRSLLEQNAIGEVRRLELRFHQPVSTKLVTVTEDNWRLNPAISGGGLFHDLAPHQLDLMLYFFGAPLSMCGLSANTGRAYEAADTTAGQVLFANNIFFHGSWCFSAEDKVDQCEITGTRGSIVFSVFEQRTLVITIDGERQELHFEPLAHVQRPMIEAVTRFFLGLDGNPCSAEEGLAVMEIIDAFTL